jgi:hypothetical protein
MAKITKIVFLFLLFFGTSLSTILYVPEGFPNPQDRIQQAID